MIALGLIAAFADQGVHWIEPPTVRDGQVTGRVQLDDPRGADGLTVVADGRSLPTTGTPVDLHGTTTILSIDASGSFRKHYALALNLAEPMVGRVSPRHAVGLMVFGLRAHVLPPTTDPAEYRRHLAKARSGEAVQKETRLAAFLLDGIDRVASERPVDDQGLRRLVVFTDAGEESSVFEPDDVVKRALARRVRVDMVVFARDNRSYAEDLDRLMKIARLTGGSVLEIHDHEVADDALVKLVDQGSGLFDLTAPICGESAPTISIVGVGGLRTDPVQLAGTLPSCDGRAPREPESKPSPAGVQPRESVRSTPLRGAPSKAAGLICLLLTVATFVGLGLVALWFARRNDRPSAVEAPPTPPEARPPDPPADPVVPPTEEPRVAPVAAKKEAFSMRLPERHLVVTAGEVPVGTRWRFSGRILRIGANPEDNDVVVDLAQVSGNHASFELFPSGAVFVEDLGSSNGTFVDGVRITPGERMEVPVNGRVALSNQLTVEIAAPQRELPTKDES